MLDEKSVIPLYYQLKEILKEKIKEGSWKEGDKVPSEREIMETYNISRATVRKALDDLMNEGLIERKQGVGTFVAKSKFQQDLTGELAFVHQAREQGLRPSFKVFHAALENDTPKRILNIFNLDESSEIFKIIGVLYADNEPIILETGYIPLKLAPNILEKELERTIFFDYLRDEHNIAFTHSTLDIEPIIVSDFEASHLKADAGKPALSSERIMYAGESAIVVQKRIMLGERCKYFFTLKQSTNAKNDYMLSLKFGEKRD